MWDMQVAFGPFLSVLLSLKVCFAFAFRFTLAILRETGMEEYL